MFFLFAVIFPVSNIHTATFFLYNEIKRMIAASGMADT